jgi:hypothetical protein
VTGILVMAEKLAEGRVHRRLFGGNMTFLQCHIFLTIVGRVFGVTSPLYIFLTAFMPILVIHNHSPIFISIIELASARFYEVLTLLFSLHLLGFLYAFFLHD